MSRDDRELPAPVGSEHPPRGQERAVEKREAERLRAIFHRWLQLRRKPPPRFNRDRRHESAATTAIVVAICHEPIDAALWRTRGIFNVEIMSAVPSYILLVCLISAGFVQMLLLRSIALRWGALPPRHSMGKSILWSTLAAIPIFGLWSLSLGIRWMKDSSPDRCAELLPDTALLDAVDSPAAARSWFRRKAKDCLRWIEERAFLGVVLACFISWLFLVSWLRHPEAERAAARAGLIVWSAIVHLTNFTGLAVSLRQRAAIDRLPRHKALLQVSLALLLLPPVPYIHILGILGILLLPSVTIFPSPDNLSHWVARAKTEMRSLSSWLGLEEVLRRLRGASLFERSINPAASPVSLRVQKIVTLLRLQTFSLILDSCALAWLLLKVTAGNPPTTLYAKGCLGSMSLVANLVFIAGLAALAMKFFRRFGAADAQPSSGNYFLPSLLGAQLAIVSGSILGSLLASGYFSMAERLAPYGLAAYFITRGMRPLFERLLPSRWRPRPERGPFFHLLLDGILLSILVGSIIGASRAGALSFHWLLLFPVRLLFLGFRYITWLLHPLSIRQALRRPGLEPLGWMALILAAVAPFGGWFLPLLLPLRETLIRRFERA